MIHHIIITVIAVILCLVPVNVNRRTKYMMPLAFIIVTFFFAIRYNYGLDYVPYLDAFYNGDNATSWRNNQERLFYMVMNFFSQYYKFVIFYTVLIMAGLYFWVRRYCNEKYYALFFLMFMFMQSMSYNMMSSMRSTMAAFILWVALYFFYIRKKNWILYVVMLFVASGFHLSVLSFLALPLVDFVVPKVKGTHIFCFFIGCFLLSSFGNEKLFSFIVSSNSLLETYSTYYDRVENNNISIFGTMNNALFLIPAFYICRAKGPLLKYYHEIFVLSVLYLTIYSLNFDIQNRFSSYIGIFFIVIISIIAGGFKIKNKHDSEQEFVLISSTERWTMLAIIIFKVGFDYYKFFLLMSSPYYLLIDGNPLLYQTIFDAPKLP